MEISVSDDGHTFTKWFVCDAQEESGPQIFKVDPISNRYKFIKYTVLETFGSSKTYMNNLFLFEEYINQDNLNMTEMQPFNNEVNFNDFNRNKFRSSSPNLGHLRNTYTDSENISS